MPENALAKSATALSVVRHVDEAAGLERIEATIDISPYLYNPSGSETGGKTRAITSAGYAMINNVKGVSFGTPQIMERTPDTLVVALTGEYYNAAGTLVRDVDVVEMDYRVFYLRMRANWVRREWNKEKKRYEIVDRAKVEISYDAQGNPIQRITLPEDAEKEIYSKILWLRQNGMRVLITVLKNRLIKQATGIKSVPTPAENAPAPVYVVGYRPTAPVGSAAEIVTNLYGPRPEAPASDEIHPVMAEMAADDDPQAEILAAAEAIRSTAVPQEAPSAPPAAGLDLQSPQHPPAHSPMATSPSPPSGDTACADCGIAITSEKVIAFSRRVYKTPLCMKCQNKRKGAAAQ